MYFRYGYVCKGSIPHLWPTRVKVTYLEIAKLSPSQKSLTVRILVNDLLNHL